MCALSIELLQPVVKIGLELLDTGVDVLSKSYLIELIKNCFMEPFDDPVRLRMSRLGTSVFYVVKRQI